MSENLSNFVEQRRLFSLIPIGKERRLKVHEKVYLGLSLFGILRILEVIGPNSIAVLGEKKGKKTETEIFGGYLLANQPYQYGTIFNRSYTFKLR